MKTKAVVAAAAAILWLSSYARSFVLHERLDGAMVSSIGPASAGVHLRVNISLNPFAVSGSFLCKEEPAVIGHGPVGGRVRQPEQSSPSQAPCFGRIGTLTNVVVMRRPDPRDFFIDDFDADLSFAGMAASCHVTAAAPSLGNRLQSVTGVYTCTDAAGSVADNGTFVAVRHGSSIRKTS